MSELTDVEQLIFGMLFWLIGCVIVCVLTRIFRFKYDSFTTITPKETFIAGLIAILIGSCVLDAMAYLIVHVGVLDTFGIDPREGGVTGVTNVVFQIIALIIVFTPIVYMMRKRNEQISTVGITSSNLLKGLVIGMILSGPVLFRAFWGGEIKASEVIEVLKPMHVHIPFIISTALCGFGEEIAYRGYLQSRAIAYIGRWKGLFFTSVLFALLHIPNKVIVSNMTTQEAVLASIDLIPVSIFMGYLMLRTGNVIVSGLFHALFLGGNLFIEAAQLVEP